MLQHNNLPHIKEDKCFADKGSFFILLILHHTQSVWVCVRVCKHVSGVSVYYLTGRVDRHAENSFKQKASPSPVKNKIKRGASTNPPCNTKNVKSMQIL